MLKLDPNEVCDVTLSAYENEPPDTKPTFVMAFPTARKLREAERHWADGLAAVKKNDVDGWHSGMVAALKVGLRNWKNIFVSDGGGGDTPMPFDANRIDELLTEGEMRDLYARWQRATRLSDAEKKASPSHSGGGLNTASGAAAESASTNPESPNA